MCCLRFVFEVCFVSLQVLVVRFASLFDVKDHSVTFLGGKRYGVETLRAMGAGDLLNSMFDFSEKLVNLGLSEEEMSLFTAVVLVSAGRGRCLWIIYSIKIHGSTSTPPHHICVGPQVGQGRPCLTMYA